jgi:hypothetical protein
VKTYLSAVSFVLFIAGYVPYIASVVRGKARPSKATWIIWAALDVILAASMLRSGTLNGQMAAACFGATTVAILAVRKGEPGWTTIDKISFAGAFLGLAAWWLSGDPTFGIVSCLAVIAVGAVPTVTSAWREPYRENVLAWSLFEASCIAAILAIPSWTIAAAGQPMTFMAITTTALPLLIYRRMVLRPE